ncbi:hypothetical protein [Nocardioides sp.]|uniref:hypothetical protein n=1 Tax=Nocardioides sp. TaxID=35761 RepID=UPI003515D142
MATSHKRETARRTPRAALLAGSLAALATTGAVATGVLTSAAPEADLTARDRLAAVDDAAVAGAASGAVRDLPLVSRSAPRTSTRAPAAAVKPPTRLQRLLAPAAVRAAVAGAEQRRWTTAALNIWSRPDASAAKLGELDEATRVLLTGRRFGERAEIVLDGKARWVTAGHFSTEKPATIGGDCTNGTSVPAGVSPNIKKVHAAVCAAFPEITTYGTFRSDGEHSQGLAVDIMVSGERGWQIADFVRENFAALGVNYVIYAQKIWSVERSGEGWRGMENRGSPTANHFDHVHVTVY